SVYSLAMQPCNLPSCLRLGIDPVAVHLGPLALYWYGLLVAVGFVLAIRLASREAERRGLDPDQLLSAALVGALVGLLMARVFYVLQNNPGAYLDPRQLAGALSLWQGGLSFYGGLFGGILGVGLYTARNGLSTLRFLDVAALAAPLGQAVGRLGNVINGDLTGLGTRGGGVEYTNASNLLVPPHSLGRTQHPVAIYDVVLELALFGLLFYTWRRRALRLGQLAGLYLAGWATGQLFLQAWRDLPVVFAGLKVTQLTALPIIAGGLYLFLRSSAGATVDAAPGQEVPEA
ncbi:MAG: prolipoprotein diacylglyceryl transferase, partial [Candidatus Dormibacteraeota bacterium]|nr:prolipoprotein diacylglyceryl transferase [Candidatus Dormibacteraeota bacterium]